MRYGKNGYFGKRKDPADKLNYRSMSIQTRGDGAPSTVDEKSRSVEVIGATEEPVEVFDYDRYEIIPEVLLMDGVELPGSRQVPLLDSHSRYSTSSVLGSFRGMKTDNGQLIGRVHFSSVPEAEGPWTKVREGHLTDFSVGYRVIEAQWVPDGEKTTIKGRSFVGPVKVATRWRPKELSAVTIGADELAKARGAHNNKQPEKTDGVDTMNKKLRKLLEKRGLSKDASDDEAWAFFFNSGFTFGDDRRQDPEPDASAEPVDEDKVRAEAQRIERERIAEIGAMCRKFDVDESVQERMIKDGTPVDKARELVLKEIERTRQEPVGQMTVEKDEREKFREAAVDGVMLRAALPVEKPAAGATELQGMTLRELARESLRIAGERIPSHPVEMVGRALTTGELPYVLAASANKALLRGFEMANETYGVWCGTRSVTDFKSNTLHRVSEAEALEEVPEHGDYQYGSLSEKKETFQLATYGKIFAITRQVIINDDLGALTDIPAKHGRAAARKIGDVAYAVLTANGAMGDGNNLFDATNHSNYVASGSGAAPGQATIAAGILAMGIQKDINGVSNMNIRPEYIIAPKALEGGMEVFFNSFQYADSDTIATDSSLAATRRNPYAGSYFTRVYDSRLDTALATGWYLAGPKGMTVDVIFLNGQSQPYMEQRQGWTVDGVEYKVRIDVAAKAVDWVALYFNYGA